MIRRTDNIHLMENRKKVFQIAKKNKWVPYLHIINDIIENRLGGKPIHFDGQPFYGIDSTVMFYGKHNDNEEMITQWLANWISYLNKYNVSYKKTIL